MTNLLEKEKSVENKLQGILKRQPWTVSYVNIGQRCHNENHPKYKFYGARGIRRDISSAELKRMWIRDRAFLMKSPSVDRVDANKNYTFGNCRYIEFSDNRKEANSRRSKSVEKNYDPRLRHNLYEMLAKPIGEMDAREASLRFVSPPYHGIQRIRNRKPVDYPKQLSGLHRNLRQRIRISGDTQNRRGGFGGVTGAYGMTTGGAYRT